MVIAASAPGIGTLGALPQVTALWLMTATATEVGSAAPLSGTVFPNEHRGPRDAAQVNLEAQKLDEFVAKVSGSGCVGNVRWPEKFVQVFDRIMLDAAWLEG